MNIHISMDAEWTKTPFLEEKFYVLEYSASSGHFRFLPSLIQTDRPVYREFFLLNINQHYILEEEEGEVKK